MVTALFCSQAIAAAALSPVEAFVDRHIGEQGRTFGLLRHFCPWARKDKRNDKAGSIFFEP